MLRRNSLGHGARPPRPIGYEPQNGQSYQSACDRQCEDSIRGDSSLTESRIVKKLAISDPHLLVRLNLSNSQIKGETAFWAALKPLCKLTTLNLQNCGLLFAHLGYLPQQVTQLNLNDNNVQELSLSRFFPHLKHVECRNNRLLKANFPAGNPSVEFLALSHNKLSILNVVELSSLQHLEADYNELVVINLSPATCRVQLRHCSLKSLMFMSKLKALQQVDLSCNQLSDVRLNTYLPKPELWRLNLSQNAIKYVEGLEIACPNLRQLMLNNNELYSLKAVYTEVAKLASLESVDLTSNDFERNEDQSYVKQVLARLQGQLTHLRTINRAVVQRVEIRGTLEARSVESSRRGQSRGINKPQKEAEYNKQNRIPLKSMHAQNSSYGIRKHQSNQPPSERTPPKYEDDETPTKTFRASSNSQFKESPYRLCSELLASARDYSAGETVQHKPVLSVNNNVDKDALPVGLDVFAETAKLFPESHLETDMAASQNFIDRSYQNVSFGAKNVNLSSLSLSRDLNSALADLLELCWIPSRPILKSEKSCDICCKIEDGPEMSILTRVFAGYNKRPDLIKKNTNLVKQSEIIERKCEFVKPMIVFLRVPKLDGRLFRQVTSGKTSFQTLLCQVGKAAISATPDPSKSLHIVLLSDHHDAVALASPAGIPIQEVDRFTPVYYIETNDTQRS